jgi:hypothetical protein
MISPAWSRTYLVRAESGSASTLLECEGEWGSWWVTSFVLCYCAMNLLIHPSWPLIAMGRHSAKGRVS